MLALTGRATHPATVMSPTAGAAVLATAMVTATALSTAAVPRTRSISTAWPSLAGTR